MKRGIVARIGRHLIHQLAVDNDEVFGSLGEASADWCHFGFAGCVSKKKIEQQHLFLPDEESLIAACLASPVGLPLSPHCTSRERDGFTREIILAEIVLLEESFPHGPHTKSILTEKLFPGFHQCSSSVLCLVVFS